MAVTFGPFPIQPPAVPPAKPAQPPPTPPKKGDTKGPASKTETPHKPAPKPSIVPAAAAGAKPSTSQTGHRLPTPDDFQRPAPHGTFVTAQARGLPPSGPAVSALELAVAQARAKAAAAVASTPTSATNTNSAASGFVLARPPRLPFTPEETAAMKGVDLEAARILGIRPSLQETWRPFVQIGESGPFKQNEAGQLVSTDPNYRVGKSTNGLGTTTELQVLEGRTLGLSADDRRRLAEFARIPKDLTWDSLLRQYGSEFKSLAPAVQERVKQNPRLAVAGLLGLTTPAAPPAPGLEQLFEDTSFLPRVGAQPGDLGGLAQVRRNTANGSYLSVGCEGGYVSGKGEQSLDYMGWDEKHGLVAPAAAFIPVNDDDSTIGMIAGAIVGFGTAGLGFIASGAASGAVSSLASGGDAFKGAALGALGGGVKLVLPGLTEALGGGVMGSLGANALTGGVLSAAKGGSFSTGALSGALSVITSQVETGVYNQLSSAGVSQTLAQAGAKALGSGLRAAAKGQDGWSAALAGGAQVFASQLERMVNDATGNTLAGKVITAAVSNAVVAAVSKDNVGLESVDAAMAALGEGLLQLQRAEPMPEAPKLAAGEMAVWNKEKGSWDVQNARSISGEPMMSLEVATGGATPKDYTLTNGPISAASLVQSAEGNCFALAPFDELARKQPGLLESNVRFADDGSTATVRLYDANQNPVFVTVDTSLYQKDGKTVFGVPSGADPESGLRLQIIQKALALAMPTLENPSRTIHGSYDGLRSGGHPDDVLTYLTGRKAEFTTLDPATDSPASVFNRLQALQRASEPIVAGTSAGDPRTMFTRYGLVPGHAYSVIGAYEDENQQLHVRLRNPWGQGEPGGRFGSVTANDGSNDGIFSMPMTDFITTFEGIAARKP